MLPINIEMLTVKRQTYLELTLGANRQLVDIYVERHAVSQRDVAFANGVGNGSITGVKGTGKYKTWTADMMLKVSYLDLIDFTRITKVEIYIIMYQFKFKL